MQYIRSHLVVILFTGFITSALLISLPSYSVIAADNNSPAQIPNNAPSNKKTITWGGDGEDMGASTAVDGSGNVYISGYFNGTVDFNPGIGVDSHTSNGGRDVFLSKFNASGNFVWTKTWGGTGDERGESIALDGSGNVYVAGPFRTTVDFDPGVGIDSHTAPGTGNDNDAYLSKFDASGNFQWVKTWGGAYGDQAYSVALDGSGNVYVVGDFSSLTVDFDPGNGIDAHTNHGLFDAFLTKFASDGTFQWAKTWGGEGYDDEPGVAVDSLGNVYVGGMYGSTSPTLNFDPAGGAGGLGHPAHDSGGVVDVFLSKFNSSGTFQWVQTWGGQGKDDVGQTVTVDRANNVYVSGRFGCVNCDFDPGAGTNLRSSNGDLDAFISKFDPSGTFLWAKTWGGTGWDAEGGLTIDSSNNVYVTGIFQNTVDFGSGSGVLSNGLGDASLSKFDSAGNFQWVQTWGGIGDDVANKPVSDAAGNIYVTGWFYDVVDFDPGSGVDNHISNGAGDVFLSTFNDANTISGNVGIAGATLNYTVDTTKTVIADGSGDYSFTVPYNWSGTVTPAKAGYTFSPGNKSYVTLKVDQTGQSFSASPLIINSKVLTTDRAIAKWPSGIPSGEKRPVVVFLPGWGGEGAVNASISVQNTNLVNEGYVTLAVGFDSIATWISDIDVKALQGLDKLCDDAAIPANCNAIILEGSSYGGAQNYWVIEYLRNNGYAGGVGNKGKALGFLSEDAGYGAPGTLTNSTTGAYTRTGLANTSFYGVAMIENLGDTTFPVDECTWGNCGARELSNAHLARGDKNVFSMCPSDGEHGTRGYTNWNAWVISAIKTMIHVTYGVPVFTDYAIPSLVVGNSCANITTALPGLSVSGINIIANGQPIRLRGINMGDPFLARNSSWYPNLSTADYVTISKDWQANVVRISIFPTQWKNMDHATLLAGLAKEVNAALNNGMYVIISYHVIGWPDGWYQSAYPGNPSDTYDSNLSVASSFWTQMAQTYGPDKRIIFDLWNEPAHDSSDWSDVNYWTSLKPFYEDLIQTVRSNGAQNIVIATGSGWASWLGGIKDNPLSDSNVVYAYHKYSVEGSNTPTEWNKDTGGLIGIKPVIVSEWGYEDADVTNPTWSGSQSSYGDPFTLWMENNKLGNLAWMYHHEWTPAVLKPDGNLTNYGTFVKNYISRQSSVRFAVIGDYGLAGQEELDVANQVKSWGPNFIVTLGDNNYSYGAADTIDANIGQYYHNFITPYIGSYGVGATTDNFYPILGNHDWATTNAQPYLNYFSLPGNERYYDFVQGPVHFFMLDSDSHEPDGNTGTSVQATWLKNSLSASSSPWNIVLLHHAPFSSGQHGSNATLQWPFEAWGADAVLAGHDHTYERIIKGTIPYFVNGLGGYSKYNFGIPVAGSQLRYNADYGAMLVDATNTYVNFKFITRTGAVIDSFALGTMPKKTDLIITNVTLIPAVPQPNQTFEVSITIKNQGNVDATGIIYRDVYIDRDPSTIRNPVTGCPPTGEFYRSDFYTNLAPLAPGMSDTKNVTITGGLSDSFHKIWAYVDSRCLIDEK